MRIKIILTFIVITLIVSSVTYFHLNSYYKTFFTRQTEEQLSRNITLFLDSKVLAYSRLSRIVEGRAKSIELRDIFSPISSKELLDTVKNTGKNITSESEIADLDADTKQKAIHLITRRRAFGECEAFSVALKRDEYMGRAPAIVLITNEQGEVLARNINPNAEPVGENLANTLKSLKVALTGKTINDIWKYNEFLLDVSASPIIRDGNIRGLLLVGYDDSDGVAESYANMLGNEIAFLYKDGDTWKINSSSVIKGTETDDLNKEIQKIHRDEIIKAMETESAEFIDLKIRDEDFLSVVGKMPINNSYTESAFLLLSSLDDALIPANKTSWLWIYTIIAIILIIIAGLALSQHFQKPVEEIEEGLLRIINGEFNYRFDVKSSEVGGLAFRINQLISVLLGEEEEESEVEKDDKRWTQDIIKFDEEAAVEDEIVRKMSQEPQSIYYERIYKEYIDGRNKIGEMGNDLSKDDFLFKLKNNESKLLEKYNAQEIRFIVQIKDGQVILKPVKIR